MKKTAISILFSLALFLSAKAQETGFPAQKEAAIKALFDKYLDMGIPGLSIAVYSQPTGLWSYAAGYADMEEQIPLTPENLHYLQSVSKTYMAVLILKLYEAGKIDLDRPAAAYLDLPLLKKIEGADKVTVRMLLNHTSGLPEYSTEPRLVSRIIQNPKKVLGVREMLSYIEDNPMDFAPGAKYSYRNTNYEILALIGDQLTGDHVAFMEKEIYEKLGLEATHYLNASNYQSELNLVEAYWDILLVGKPVNISALQRANVASMKGDDGMVASAEDAVRFLVALVSGDVLQPETLSLMQEWVTDENGKKRYGLGLTYYDLDVTYGIGHNGGGVGAGCMLLYLPEYGAAVFVATNFNTMMDSPIRRKAENLETELLMTLFAE